MSILIDDLKKEHAAILDVLDEIEGLDLTAPEAWERFKAVELNLIEHLQKEEEFLFLVLSEAAAEKPDLKKLLDSADEDMKGITRLVKDFFERYPAGGAGVKFHEEFNELLTTIRNRILTEENVFFTEYELLHE